MPPPCPTLTLSLAHHADAVARTTPKPYAFSPFRMLHLRFVAPALLNRTQCIYQSFRRWKHERAKHYLPLW
jgi:hypothetical protein